MIVYTYMYRDEISHGRRGKGWVRFSLEALSSAGGGATIKGGIRGITLRRKGKGIKKKKKGEYRNLAQ